MQNYNNTHKEYASRKNREYYEADPEKFKARARQHYQDNIEQAKERSAEWKRQHPELVQAQNKFYHKQFRALRAQLLPIAQECPELFTEEELNKLSRAQSCRSIKFLTELLKRVSK